MVYKYSFEQEVIFTLREWGKKLKRMYIVRFIEILETKKL